MPDNEICPKGGDHIWRSVEDGTGDIISECTKCGIRDPDWQRTVSLETQKLGLKTAALEIQLVPLDGGNPKAEEMIKSAKDAIKDLQEIGRSFPTEGV